MALQDDVVSRLRRQGSRLEYASMAWMTVEAAVGIVSGIVASSIVLIGFGLDSVIEFFAAAVVVWQLRGTVSEERESLALRLIAVTFFALAVYLAVESVADLVSQHRPEQSTAGIVVTGARGRLTGTRFARRSGRKSSRMMHITSRLLFMACGGR